MNVVEIAVDDLREYEYNPRNNENAVEAVAESIKQFGFKVPIVIDADNVIVAGHTRLKAAKLLGMDAVPCVIADDLNEEQIKAFRLADNKTSELAEWDFDLLDKELAELSQMDMSLFGFEDDTADEMTEEEHQPKPEIEFTKSVDEKHNYIVLYFENELDWLQAESLFDIRTVKEYSTRKDGMIAKKPRTGIGRVLDGATALSKIVGASR